MSGPRKYSDELRERATRMALELRSDPATRGGAIARVAGQLGRHPETLRGWVSKAEVDEGRRPGRTSEDTARIVELEREVRELKRANEILRTASAFFAAAELDRRLKSIRRLVSTAADKSRGHCSGRTGPTPIVRE